MHELIERLLNRRGIRDATELRGEERKVYDAWQAVLNKPAPSVEDIAAVIRKELDRVNDERDGYDNSEKRDLYLKAYSRTLKLIHLTITTPEKQRNELKAQLEQLLQS